MFCELLTPLHEKMFQHRGNCHTTGLIMVMKKSLLQYSVILICGEVSLFLKKKKKKSLILERNEEHSWVSHGF